MLSYLLEALPQRLRAAAHVALIERRPRLVEERDVRLIRQGLREVRLADTRRPVQEDTLGQLRSHVLVLVVVLYLVDDLFELLDNLVHAFDVLESYC